MKKTKHSMRNFTLLYITISVVACVEVVTDSDLMSMDQTILSSVVEREGSYGQSAGEITDPTEAGEALFEQDMQMASVDMNSVLDLSTSEAGQEVQACFGALTQCNGECVSLEQDPLHCGACNQACVINNGRGVCLNGRCEVESCDPDFFDQDNNSANGCEYQNLCTPNQACVASCGSRGLSRCSQGRLSCEPPAETCNLQDDNCDGQCDEGLQGLCRVAVHRATGVFNQRTYHAYSTQQSRLYTLGYSVERSNYFYLYQTQGPNAVSLYLCQDQMGRHLLSVQSNCGLNQSPIETLGYVLTAHRCHSQALYHLSHPETGNHLYTIDPDEVQAVITNYAYQDHGIIGYIWRNP